MFPLFRCSLALALTLGVAAPVFADPPLEPAACKVRGAKRVLVGRFQFTLEEFKAFKQGNLFATHPPGATPNGRTAHKRATLADLVAAMEASRGNARRPSANGSEDAPRTKIACGPKHIDAWCGIVDDWHYAALLARQMCNSPEIGNGEAYFKADAGYTAFNDSANHHALFEATPSVVATNQNPNIVDDGNIVLEGSCYVCTSRRSVDSATAIPRGPVKAREPAKGD